MARISTPFKRAFLRRQATLAVENSRTLEAQLEATLDERVDAVASGQAIASTSGNGQSVSFSEPGKGGPGADGIAELASELLDRYARAVATLGGTPTDAEILEQMLSELVPARWSRNDYTNLRATR